MKMVSSQSTVLDWLRNLDEESGQGMVEYAFILVLIALVVIVILITLGNQVVNAYSNISASLGA
ncbi:MAG TPA: Flp family type IVb pilin [Candidatus Solibacter sp.]|jgi:pilus assembly protein Flp/PilA|nr:Flp family type IVb pilin [Candidatus Solibacter sp.]